LIATRDAPAMNDRQIGAGLRSIRLRSDLTQREVSIAADVPRSVVQAIEHGRLRRVRVGDLTAVAAALDASVDQVLRWRGGDLGRLVNARHAALHELLARRFAGLPGWAYEPEVSFSSYGERGVVDALAWHRVSRSLLVVELKTELVDVNELLGTVDRKRRLGPDMVRARGWGPATVSAWVAIADTRTNRRTLARHATVLRAKFQADGHAMAAWLRRPVGRIDALGFLSDAAPEGPPVSRTGRRSARHAHEPGSRSSSPDR
jgi:transcriptional regulator with XRE-family HTH domain